MAESIHEATSSQAQPSTIVGSVTVNVPPPIHPRTVQDAANPRFTSLRVIIQPHETVQDIKLSIAEWPGGYWLGPFSLRVRATAPAESSKDHRLDTSTDTSGSKQTGRRLGTSKEGQAIYEGAVLGDWVEVEDIFSDVQGGLDDHVFEVITEPWSDFHARQTLLRFFDLLYPHRGVSSNASDLMGINAGSTIMSCVLDGSAAFLLEGQPRYSEKRIALPSGRKGKAGKKETFAVKREVTADDNPFMGWSPSRRVRLDQLPCASPTPHTETCVRSVYLSPFNPPTPHHRQQGHVMYLQVTLLEGEALVLICCNRGWYASKSTPSNFDPSPTVSSDGAPCPTFHSFYDLLHHLSARFSESFFKLGLFTSAAQTDPATHPTIPQSLPAFPWLVPGSKVSAVPDLLGTQLAFLQTGAISADGLDGARDWNEDIQGIKELPKEGVQDRVFRERLAQRTWADFTTASVRAVTNILRNGTPPLNPNEHVSAHMWLVSNIFVTKAVDSIDAYAHLGGDAAAFASHGKDAEGVRLLNKIDIEGLHTLGHTVIDWLGVRWVCQSVLPGIFVRHREDVPPDGRSTPTLTPAPAGDHLLENDKLDWVELSNTEQPPCNAIPDAGSAQTLDNPLIVYGSDSEDPSSLHWEPIAHNLLARLAAVCRSAAHTALDSTGIERQFYTSLDVKILKGTDGRRYALDLPRLCPVDIEWLEHDYRAGVLNAATDEIIQYPHRVTLLRPELLDIFWETEFRRWSSAKSTRTQTDSTHDSTNGAEHSSTTETDGIEKPDVFHEPTRDSSTDPKLGSAAQFALSFDMDAFVDQPPSKNGRESNTQQEIAARFDETRAEIRAVREASSFLRSSAIPTLVDDVLSGTIQGIMDGAALTRILHGRGINMRYLGHLLSQVAQRAQNSTETAKELALLQPFQVIILQEMVLRSSRHILRDVILGLLPEHAACAISHFLNCLLGSSADSPIAQFQPILPSGIGTQPGYVRLTPFTVRDDIMRHTRERFRWSISTDDWLSLRRPQLLRELATRFGFQLAQKNYTFDEASSPDHPRSSSSKPIFTPSDILTIVPIVKSTSPSVGVAEDVFEAGRMMISKGDVDNGLDVLLEAVQLYQSIHSLIHPEVAAAFNSYSSLVHQVARARSLQQMQAASTPSETENGLQPIDLGPALRFQRQACIIAERTLGIWDSQTANYYFNLAMLENLAGNTTSSLRLFRHVLSIWDVVYGGQHPELINIMSNIGVILQSAKEPALSLVLLQQASSLTEEIFGPDNINTAHSLQQVTQVHFLLGDIATALDTAKRALGIYQARLGPEHPQVREAEKNVELLQAVIVSIDQHRTNERTFHAQVSGPGMSPIPTATKLNGLRSKERMRLMNPDAVPPPTPTRNSHEGDGTPAHDHDVSSNTQPERVQDLDALVQYIQGHGAVKRGKNAMRGKRRTGSKR